MPKRDGEMTAQEAADYLGYKTPRSVHDLRRNRKITGRKERAGLHETRWYYSRAEVEALKEAAK